MRRKTNLLALDRCARKAVERSVKRWPGQGGWPRRSTAVAGATRRSTAVVDFPRTLNIFLDIKSPGMIQEEA